MAPKTLAAVVTGLQMSGATPVILEGPADREPVEQLLQLCEDPPIVIKGLDLLTVAGVLAQTRLFIGQDSGITHLAGLLGVRTVAIFGPTDPARWAPHGAHVTVVRGAPCLCPSWETSANAKKNLVSMCHRAILWRCVLHTSRRQPSDPESNPTALSLTIPYARVASSFFLSLVRT